MNTRIIALAAVFATFVPALALAQKPPAATAAVPVTFPTAPFTPVVVPGPASTPAPIASTASVAVLSPATAAQITATVPGPGTAYAQPPAAPIAVNEPVGPTAAPAPGAPATQAPQHPASERGNFRFSLEAGLSLWEEDVGHDQTMFTPVGQLNGFFGWTVTNGAARSDGRAFGLDLGFAIRIDADDTAVVTRHQLAAQLAWPRIFVTLSTGLATLQPTEGGDPSFGFSLDSTAGYRIAGPFYVGFTLGVDIWEAGGSPRRTGVTLGFAVD